MRGHAIEAYPETASHCYVHARAQNLALSARNLRPRVGRRSTESAARRRDVPADEAKIVNDTSGEGFICWLSGLSINV